MVTKNKHTVDLELHVIPLQHQADETNVCHTPSHEEIRQRAYEIYLERGGLPGDELDDWLQAERELDGRAPQPGGSTDIEGHKR